MTEEEKEKKQYPYIKGPSGEAVAFLEFLHLACREYFTGTIQEEQEEEKPTIDFSDAKKEEEDNE